MQNISICYRKDIFIYHIRYPEDLITMSKISKTAFLAGIALLLALPLAMADSSTVSSSATVTNAAPTVGTVTPNDPVTLTESTTKAVQCNATITDTNGYADVSTVNGTLYDEAATNFESGNDNNNKFTNSTCTLSGGSGTTINAKCEFYVHYSANAAEWTCALTAVDNSSATGSANVTTVTVNSLTALATTSTLSFGSVALGSTTSNANELNVTVNNTGNAQIDVSLDGYGASDGDGFSMTCSVGGTDITIGNLKYNLTASNDYTANMTSLTDSAVTQTDFNLAAETTDSTASTKDVFWKMQISTTDVGGSCTGNVVVTAV